MAIPQQTKTKRIANLPFEWPDKPKFPVLKTIGGDADRQLMADHHAADAKWYGDVQATVKTKVAELSDTINGLNIRLTKIEGK